MKRAIILVITLCVLALITVAGLELLKRAEDKNSGALRFSETSRASLEDNFFAGYYRPLQPQLPLTQQAASLYFDSAFLERAWMKDTSGLHLFAGKLPTHGFNLVIHYRQVPQTEGFTFDLVPLSDSNVVSGVAHYGNNILVYQTQQITDTIWFNFREKNRDSSSAWIEADSLIAFVKLPQE